MIRVKRAKKKVEKETKADKKRKEARAKKDATFAKKKKVVKEDVYVPPKPWRETHRSTDHVPSRSNGVTPKSKTEKDIMEARAKEAEAERVRQIKLDALKKGKQK